MNQYITIMIRDTKNGRLALAKLTAKDIVITLASMTWEFPRFIYHKRWRNGVMQEIAINEGLSSTGTILKNVAEKLNVDVKDAAPHIFRALSFLEGFEYIQKHKRQVDEVDSTYFTLTKKGRRDQKLTREVQLKVGATYVSRIGDFRRITKEIGKSTEVKGMNPTPPFFVDETGRLYTRDGHWLTGELGPTENDLVNTVLLA